MDSLSSCWIDISLSAAIFATALVSTSVQLYGFLGTVKTQSPNEAESEPLLPDGNPMLSKDGESTAFHRSVLIILLFTYGIEVFLAFYHLGHPTLISIIAPRAAMHLLSAFLALLGFLVVCTISMFFASKSVMESSMNSNISYNQSGLFITFYYLATTHLLLPAYAWATAIFSHRPGSESAFSSRFDICLLILSISQFLLTFTIIATSKRVKSKNVETSSLAIVLQKLNTLIPFLWPSSLKLQLLVICCFALLALGRLVNILVPYTYKILIDELTNLDPTTHIPFKIFTLGSVTTYTLLRGMQGTVGVLTSLQYFLWIPVSQFTTRTISVRMLQHLHSLSLDFHLNRKTGEVLRVMDRGTSSIGSLLSSIAFNIVPVFVDIFLAFFYFVFMFDLTLAWIILATMATYIFFTVVITEWRTKFRREMNDLDSISRARSVDSLLNYETVKYFCNEEYELDAFEKSVLEYQKADYKSNATLPFLNTAQNFVISVGLFLGLTICAQRVYDSVFTVGDFVAFVTYLLQLYQPLNWFGTYYRSIQQVYLF